jgi:Protein of unknown function (DUF1257)
MSHFSKIKTTLKDLDILKKSLTDLSITWNTDIKMIKGYKNQNEFANLVIKQENNYDLGFTWNGLEYQLIADLQFWQQPWSVELFLDKITQRYAYNSIINITTTQGFQPIEEVTEENGIIKLVLQRWS